MTRHLIGYVRLEKTGHNATLCRPCGERACERGRQAVPLYAVHRVSPNACHDCGKPLRAATAPSAVA